jgi:hypothetical protein
MYTLACRKIARPVGFFNIRYVHTLAIFRDDQYQGDISHFVRDEHAWAQMSEDERLASALDLVADLNQEHQ